MSGWSIVSGRGKVKKAVGKNNRLIDIYLCTHRVLLCTRYYIATYYIVYHKSYTNVCIINHIYLYVYTIHTLYIERIEERELNERELNDGWSPHPRKDKKKLTKNDDDRRKNDQNLRKNDCCPSSPSSTCRLPTSPSVGNCDRSEVAAPLLTRHRRNRRKEGERKR
jgi:hypothetical protein